MNKAFVLSFCAALALPFAALATNPPLAGTPPPTAVSTEPAWLLNMPQSDRLVHRGLPDLDNAGVANGAILYPAPNVAGFLVSVLTHGAVVDKIKEDQRNQQQEAADKIWAPYLPILENFGHRELMQRALPKAASRASMTLTRNASTNVADRGKGIESAPVFSMTHDQLAIMLDNTIVLHAPAGSAVTSHRMTLRVISEPRETTDPVAYWTSNNGEDLKEEEARLMALSLDIAMLDLSGETHRPDAPYKTVRYREGSIEKMERAQVLADRCSRVLLRTLRGALMSVPAARPGNNPASNCDNPSNP